MKEKLAEVIKSLMPYESMIYENTDLSKDLGFDSLKMVELIFEIEKKYGIEFNENDLDITKIRTVGDLERLLQGYIK